VLIVKLAALAIMLLENEAGHPEGLGSALADPVAYAITEVR